MSTKRMSDVRTDFLSCSGEHCDLDIIFYPMHNEFQFSVVGGDAAGITTEDAEKVAQFLLENINKLKEEKL